LGDAIFHTVWHWSSFRTALGRPDVMVFEVPWASAQAALNSSATHVRLTVLFFYSYWFWDLSDHI